VWRASDFDGLFGDKGKIGGLPGIEAAHDVGYIAESGALQHAAGDGAAVAAFAVDRNAGVAIHLR